MWGPQEAGKAPLLSIPTKPGLPGAGEGSSPFWAGHRAHHLGQEYYQAEEDCVPIYGTWGNVLLLFK